MDRKNLKRRILTLAAVLIASVVMPIHGSAATTATVTHAESKGMSYAVTGIDVSSENGTIDWTSVAGDGISFAFIRSGYTDSENGMHIDDNAKTNMNDAYSAGIEVGLYYDSLAKSTETAAYEAAQACFTLSESGLPADTIVAIHCTNESGLTAAKRTEIVDTFCKEIKNKGYTPLIYADEEMLATGLEVEQLKDYGFWIDQTGTACTYTGAYDYWHFDDAGTVKGIEGSVDVDYQYKDCNQVAELTCDAPTVKAVSTNCTQVTVSWNSVEGADGYCISRYNKDTEDYEIVGVKAGNTNTTYQDENVLCNTEYRYIVRAFRYDTENPENIGYSENSEIVSVTTPTLFKGIILPSKANVRETPADYAKVVMKIENSATVNILGSVENIRGSWYRIGKVVDGVKTYGYIKKAYVTDKSNAPAVVKLYAYQKTFSTIKLKWKTSSQAEAYEIQRYNKDTKQWETLTTTDEDFRAFLDTDLTASTTYKYRARAARVFGKYIIYSDYCSTVKQKTKAGVYGKTKSAVSIRETTSAKAKEVATLAKDTKVRVIGTKYSWYLIKVSVKGKTKTGYLSKKSVKLL